jgi:hypothetical protein
MLLLDGGISTYLPAPFNNVRRGPQSGENMRRLIKTGVALALLLIGRGAGVADQNHFASIYLDGKKIGQIHYMVRINDQGMVEELKTRSSLSILGFQVYYFTQDLHEVWKSGELQNLQGNTDDHNTIYKSSLQRNSTEYDGVLNGKNLTLPHNAFPTSAWHYAITQQSLLFDLKDLRLMKVKVSKSEDPRSPPADNRFPQPGLISPVTGRLQSGLTRTSNS